MSSVHAPSLTSSSRPTACLLVLVETFNLGHNSGELAALLFGDANRWGKLPVTIYSQNFTQGGGGLPAAQMKDYAMPASSSSPGRTYRFYQGRPLFEFGHGELVGGLARHRLVLMS